jgi:hypothetical protein
LISRVNVYKNEVSHGCSHLNDGPFPFVIGIDADSIFGFEAKILDKSSGQTERKLMGFLIGERDILRV